MMGVRLLETRRLLKETGRIYLHCDPTASYQAQSLCWRFRFSFSRYLDLSLRIYCSPY